MSTPYERPGELATSSLAREGPAARAQVGATLVFESGALRTADGGIDIEALRAHIAAQLHRVPRCRQRLVRVPVERSPVWVDDRHFDLDYHVRHTSLPRPGDESQLKQLVARILSQELDREKPLWELWVVEGVEAERFALVLKTHAAIGEDPDDADLLAVLLAPEPGDDIPEPRAFDPRPTPGPLALLRDELLRRARSPFGFARPLLEPRALVQSVEARAREWIEVLVPVETPRAESVLCGPSGPHRCVDWVALDLAEVRAVKSRLGGSVHDLVLAVLTGALRRFLERRGVGRPLPDLAALTPIGVYSNAGGSLRIHTSRVALPVAEPDALARFERVQAMTRGLRRAGSAVPADDLASATRWTASTLLARGALELERAGTAHLAVSNVPGPQLPLYLLESRLLACYPHAPLFPRQGLAVALFSYAGRLYWGLGADRERIPDLPLMVDEIVASFAELRSGVGLERARRSSSGKRSSARKRRRAPGDIRAEL